MRAWVAFGAIFLVVFGGFLALSRWLDAPPDLPESPSVPKIAAEYRSDYETLSQRLAQVPGILPAGPVDQPSCAVPVPLEPALAYSDVVYGEPDEPDNTEIVTERMLTDPLLEDDTEHQVAYPSDLLALIRASTHPSEWYPGGSNPHPGWFDHGKSENQIRARLENGLATRYLIVLRPVSYVPYGETDLGLAVGSVDLDAFLVDLHTLTLVCSFAVQQETTLVTAVVGDMAPSYQLQLYEDLLGLVTGRIREQLTALTGGTWL